MSATFTRSLPGGSLPLLPSLSHLQGSPLHHSAAMLIFPPPPSPMAAAARAALLLPLLSLFSPIAISADLFSLVYKGCANHSFGVAGGVSQQYLASLSSSLIAQSSSSKFFKTTASGSSSLFGLFQCRGDLSPSDCSACVNRVPSLWSKLCGPTVAARVQLAGCYALYEVSNFPKVSGMKMLYKYCSAGNGGGNGFEEKKGTALAQLQSRVKGDKAGVGFYATRYESVYAMAQCQGDLSAADCEECISQAVQKAEVECGESTSAQMYLSRCYITYSNYGHGVPRDAGGNGGGGGGSGQTGKTVAIVVGGAAGVAFLVMCGLFVRSLYRKKDDY